MNEIIKNPSLIPDWFITSADGKVYGMRDASGNEHIFVGSSEKGEDGKDGKTPALKINNEDGFKWQVNYDNGQGWIDVPGSPAASGMVGPQGETGPSGNSIVLQSAQQVEGGIQVTLAWGNNQSETSAFLIPSGAPGSSYTFDQTTTSGVGSTNPIGVNTNVIATKDDLDEKVDLPPAYDPSHSLDRFKVMDAGTSAWEDLNSALDDEGVLKYNELLPENGISGGYVSQDNKYHFGITTSGMEANKQYAWTTSGWSETSDYAPGLPLNIGTGNTVSNDSIGAIGNNCNVGVKSIALSYKGASAYSNSMALGDDNFASANSFAAGWGVKANQYSVIFGHGNTNDPSETSNYSIAAGDAVYAYNYSQAFGRGLEFSGGTIGGMVIGGWNKTMNNALFVAGNGSNSDAAHRSDATVLTKQGVWSATDFHTFEGNNKLSEKVSTTDSPHGSNLKAELAVVTFSDNEIINFVDGGGCSGKGTLFFRVE